MNKNANSADVRRLKLQKPPSKVFKFSPLRLNNLGHTMNKVTVNAKTKMDWSGPSEVFVFETAAITTTIPATTTV